MINEVRNTVMALVNKANNGYITPIEFNLFAHQAQLDIYEEYQSRYQKYLQQIYANIQSTGVSDMLRRCEEIINLFTIPSQTLTIISGSAALPSDIYKINEVYYGSKRIEPVSQNDIQKLLNSDKTAPNTIYPAYTKDSNSIRVYPTSITTGVTLNYQRYPAVPKWTYVTVSDAPLFNPAALDYQDFELPQSDMMDLIIRICQMAGVSIREQQVIQDFKSEEVQEKAE